MKLIKNIGYPHQHYQHFEKIEESFNPLSERIFWTIIILKSIKKKTDKAVLSWFNSQRDTGFLINWPNLKEQVENIFSEFRLNWFHAKQWMAMLCKIWMQKFTEILISYHNSNDASDILKWFHRMQANFEIV